MSGSIGWIKPQTLFAKPLLSPLGVVSYRNNKVSNVGFGVVCNMPILYIVETGVDELYR